MQGVEGLVVGEFVASVEGFRRVGEDFGDEAGEAFVGGGLLVAGVAGDEDIGVVEAVEGFDAGFHVGDVDLAAAAAQVVAEQDGEAEGKGDVNIGGSGHAVEFAVDIFMFELALFLQLEVFAGAEALGGGDHGWFGWSCAG